MTRSKTKTGILAASLLALCAGSAAAAVRTVGPGLGVFDHLTITAAIAASSDGDEIVIEPGLYPENIVISNKDLILRNSETPGTVTVFGQGIGRVFEIIDSTVTLEGLTITGGSFGNDAGIRAAAPTVLTIENCVIEDNHATSTTGGMFVGNRLTMRNSIVRDNTSPGSAGGVFLRGAGPHLIENCVFENNSTGDTDTTGDSGGALTIDGSSNAVLVEDTLFLGNSSTGRGGAISLLSFIVRFDRCTFDSNTSPRGAAIWVSDQDIARANNCLFIDNDATAFGGAVYNEQLFEATNCTFVGNTDSSSFNTFEGVRTDSRTELLNCIVVNPSTGSHGGAGIFDPRYSLIPEASGTVDSNGNFEADPEFLDAPTGDYRLASGSPAIDAGDSLGSIGTSVLSLLVDFDGNVRNLDDQSVPNSGVPAWELNIDLGAFEFQPDNSGPGCSPADLAAPFGVLNFFDLGAYLTEFNQGC